MAKKIFFILLLFAGVVFAQTTPPIGYTPHYKFRMWGQGARPSADSLNQNWKDIDSVIYSVSQSVVIDTTDIAYKSKMNIFTNPNSFTGKLSVNEFIGTEIFGKTITYYEPPFEDLFFIETKTPIIVFTEAGYDNVYLHGIYDFYEGQQVEIINLMNSNLVLINESNSTTSYKIYTPTREDLSIPYRGSVTLTGIDISGTKFYLITSKNF